MGAKELTDPREWIEHINKKDTKRNGLKIRFAFVKRKRRSRHSLSK